MHNLTREATIKKHRELWHWIANKTRQLHRKVWKHENLEVREYNPRGDCWCCDYANNMVLDCADCPIDWPGKSCFSKESPFYKWRHEDDPETAAMYADMIAELPEREDK